MSVFVTILSLPQPQEVHIIKGHLEAEGIECSIKDELTIQANPLISNAVGGVKLQVKEEDVEAALKILDSAGYQRYRDDNVNPYQGLQDFADKIPFFKNVRFEVRLGVFITLIITAGYLLIYFLTFPSPYKRLTETEWRVNYIEYYDKVYIPNSFGVHFSANGVNIETIDFNSSAIDLPGFKTYPIRAHWDFVNDSVIISHADTFRFVYNGRYSVNFFGKNLVLKSKSTSINCTIYSLF